jgi:hypothetical protein
MSDYDQDAYNTNTSFQNDYNKQLDHANDYWHNPAKHWETEAQINRGAEIQQSIHANSETGHSTGSQSGFDEWRSSGGYTSPSSSSGSGGGSCFVATACFEGASHPTVSFLRDYRDTILVKSKVGRAFIACYNEIGPHLAKAVNKMPETKPALRSALTHFSKKIADHYKGQLSPLTPAATRPEAVREEKDTTPTLDL